MESRKAIIGAGKVLICSQLLLQLLRFVRNVILARTLTPADFGVATTFWLTTGLLTTLTQFGVEQLLIRDKEGDSEHVGATAQLFFLARGGVIGFIILFFAEPFMHLLGAPEASDSFRWLALSALLTGLVHRDTVRLQRNLHFGPFVLSQLIPEFIITALAWPIALWCQDYNAFVYFALLNSFLNAVISHLVAERPFRVGWDTQVVIRSLNFGWPLFLNSFLLFLAMQGDRVVLAQAYSQEELGVYSVAVNLALTPTLLIIGLTSQLLLPILSRLQSDFGVFQKQYRLAFDCANIIAYSIAGISFVAGSDLVEFIYGEKYLLAGKVVGLLFLAQCIRILRSIPTSAALALGDSRNSLVSNMLRQLGLLCAIGVAYVHGSIVFIAVCGVLGELFALIFSLLWTRVKHGLPIGFILPQFVIFGCVATAAFAIANYSKVIGGVLSLTLIVSSVLIAIAVSTGISIGLRREFDLLLRKLLRFIQNVFN